MSLAAQQRKVFLSTAPFQVLDSATQYYSADQARTDLKSHFELVKIQYWNTGTLSSSTRDSSGNCSHFFLLLFLPFDFFSGPWPANMSAILDECGKHGSSHLSVSGHLPAL